VAAREGQELDLVTAEQPGAGATDYYMQFHCLAAQVSNHFVQYPTDQTDFEGDRGQLYTFLGAPVAEGAHFSLYNTVDTVWHAAGTVTVVGGTFASCWRAETAADAIV
jgi:hypothetical protein